MTDNQVQPRSTASATISMDRFKDGRQRAEQGKARTELELFHAKKAVKDLVCKIEQSNAQVKARKLEIQSLKSTSHGEEDPHYAELMHQLDCVKEELRKLKLDVSSALETKAKAEKDIEVHTQKTSSCLVKVEELRKQIEEANEEHVLVELARIEAEKEMREIESNHAAEAVEFEEIMEAAKKRIRERRREIERVKELEEKLASTKADVGVLQNEMGLIRAMEEEKKKMEEGQLNIDEEELSKAMKELQKIKDEGFQFMASMDVVREELLLVSKEKDRMKKREKDQESAIERLNTKLLNANLKLESSGSTQKRTTDIISNLSTALQQLQTEAKTAKEEKEKANQDTCAIKQELEKTEIEIMSKEEELKGAITELRAVKASEAAALGKLKSMMEETVKNRAMASQKSSTICLSNWECAYLIKKGELAHALADKKVEAIKGWVEALRAQEKETLLKTEITEREIKEIKASEEEKVWDVEKAVVVQKTMVDEASDLVDMLKARSPTPSERRSRVRRTSPMAGIKNATRSLSFTIKKRKRAMPNLGKMLRARSGSQVDVASYAALLLAPEQF